MPSHKILVCFIDDSAFERRLLAEVFPKAEPGWEWLIAASFKEAQILLAGRKPDLFLLDLWGNDPEKESRPKLASQAELETEAAKLPGLAEIYAGLESFEGDRLNELLKRLYSLVEGWRAVFQKAALAADQSLAFGLYNLSQVRRLYQEAKAVAYTRKSSAEDICRFLRAGGDGAAMKPHGPNDASILAATRAKAGEIIAYLKLVLSK